MMETEKRRTVYITHRVGKRFRWLEAGIAVERANGTLDVFLRPDASWRMERTYPCSQRQCQANSEGYSDSNAL